MVKKIFHFNSKVLVLFLCGWTHSSYSISVQANVSAKIVGAGQPFDLNITISSEKEVNIKNPILPKDISPFTLTGQSQSSRAEYSFSTAGGAVKTLKKTLSYTLVSRKEGQWTLGPVSVEVNGKVYKTKEIQVTVSANAPPPPSSLFNLPQIFQEEEDFFFPFRRREFNETTEDEFMLRPDKIIREVYLGQSMPVKWFLYKKSRRSFAVNIQPHENPQPENFWTEKVKTPSTAQFTKTEKIEGHEYFRSLAASYMFFPLKEGKLQIDPFKLTVKPIFSGFFTSSRPVILKSKPILVKVLPLPRKSRGQFTGAVGRFFVFSKTDRQQILKNDILSYKIRFEGNGNIRAIKLPPWPENSDFKVYDILESGEFSPEKSYKEYELLLSAKKPGRLKTPRLNWTTFDPDLKSYVNHELEPIEIKADEDKHAEGEEQKFFDSTSKQNNAEPHQQNLLSPLPEKESFYSQYKYLLWSLVYVFLTVLIFWKHNKFFIRKKKVRWSSILNQNFDQAQKSLEKGRYRRVGALLLNLIDQVWLKTTGTGGRELDKLLEKCPPSLRKDLGLEVKNLSAELEDLSFAERPAENDPWNQEKVEKLMKRCRTTLEKIIRCF